jgi:hypothetical protein
MNAPTLKIAFLRFEPPETRVAVHTHTQSSLSNQYLFIPLYHRGKNPFLKIHVLANSEKLRAWSLKSSFFIPKTFKKSKYAELQALIACIGAMFIKIKAKNAGLECHYASVLTLYACVITFYASVITFYASVIILYASVIILYACVITFYASVIILCASVITFCASVITFCASVLRKIFCEILLKMGKKLIKVYILKAEAKLLTLISLLFANCKLTPADGGIKINLILT